MSMEALFTQAVLCEQGKFITELLRWRLGELEGRPVGEGELPGYAPRLQIRHYEGSQVLMLVLRTEGEAGGRPLFALGPAQLSFAEPERVKWVRPVWDEPRCYAFWAHRRRQGAGPAEPLAPGPAINPVGPLPLMKAMRPDAFFPDSDIFCS